MSEIKVVVCDDHPMVIDGLKRLLNETENVRLLHAFQSALALSSHVFDGDEIVLLDLHLNDGDGLQLCKSLMSSFPSLRIIGFSGVEDTAVIAAFLKNGGKSYVIKSAGAEEIIKAIRSVANNEVFLSASVAPLLMEQMQAGKPISHDYIPRLSAREKEVLALIISEKTTQEIADLLFISVNTVETHRNNLLQKLGARNVAGMVRIAIEKGLA